MKERLNSHNFHLLSGTPGPEEKSVPDIDIERVFTDHGLNKGVLPEIANQIRKLDAFVVPSGSKYKARVNQQILRQLDKKAQVPIVIVKAPSLISEQPLGKETVEGAENRMLGAQKMITTVKEGQSTGNREIDSLLRGKIGMIGAIENGLRQRQLAHLPLERESKIFNPKVGYVDIAYAIVDIPSRGLSRQTSPRSEAVLFPHEDVMAAYTAKGSFRENTVGQFMQKRLAAEGIQIDHQDPQAYLTKKEVEAGKRDKELTRAQQLTTVVVKSFADIIMK